MQYYKLPHAHAHARAHTHAHARTHARTHTHTHIEREREGEREIYLVQKTHSVQCIIIIILVSKRQQITITDHP